MILNHLPEPQSLVCASFRYISNYAGCYLICSEAQTRSISGSSEPETPLADFFVRMVLGPHTFAKSTPVLWRFSRSDEIHVQMRILKCRHRDWVWTR